MRFKDFEITIHGDFESGDDEQDLRSAIARKLGGLSAKTSDAEAQTVGKIDDGDARWSPPLQQHLDVLKQSLESADNKSDVGNQILDLDAAKRYYEKFHESTHRSSRLLEYQVRTELNMCAFCGRLMLGESLRLRLTETVCQNIQRAWDQLIQRYSAPAQSCEQRSHRCHAQ